MRLFITGGTGFIGSYVLAAALMAGHEVVALRRSPYGAPVIPLPSQPQWCEGDLFSLEPAQLQGNDAVLHLASAGVSPKRVSWEVLVHVNVAGSLRLMELAAAAGVTRCVVAGTSHEYGKAASHYEAIPPNAPLDPINAYGASKAAAFQLLRVYAIEHQLELVYGRIFTAYGEGQYEGNFWPSLYRAAKSGGNFPMTSGRQVTDFIPVVAVADHLLNACLRTDVSVDLPLIVNIGSGVAISLRAFAEAEWERLGAVGKLLTGFLVDRPHQIDRCVPDLVGLNIADPSFH
jgi:UDP-glucose 4-epimerase